MKRNVKQTGLSEVQRHFSAMTEVHVQATFITAVRQGIAMDHSLNFTVPRIKVTNKLTFSRNIEN